LKHLREDFFKGIKLHKKQNTENKLHTKKNILFPIRAVSGMLHKKKSKRYIKLTTNKKLQDSTHHAPSR
jgi:hypothetical protein